MSEPNIVARAGEYFREAGVLIAVFGILDPMVQGTDPDLIARLNRMSFSWGLAVTGASVFLFLLGVSLEYLLDYLETRGSVATKI